MISQLIVAKGKFTLTLLRAELKQDIEPKDDSSKRQIYSDAFKRFANLQNLDNTSITTLLNSIDKSNIKV